MDVLADLRELRADNALLKAKVARLEHRPRSCKMINGTSSGYYTIYPSAMGPSINVFCDQQTDGGGWTRVSFVHVDKGIAATSAGNIPRTVLQAWEEIGHAPANLRAFRLSDSALYNLLLTNNTLADGHGIYSTPFFSEIRWRCFKKAVNRVLDLATTPMAPHSPVLRYFTGQTNVYASSSGTMRRLPEDTSILGARPYDWGWAGVANGQKGWWGITSNAVTRLSNHPMYIAWRAHWLTGDWLSETDRYECDDYVGVAGDPPRGAVSENDSWSIYVR
jgi:hypothetical protein